MPTQTKRCSTCQVVRPLTDFNLYRAAPDGRQPRCRSCSKSWYAANRDSHRANVRARNIRVRAENRERIGDYLLDHPCVDCGERDIRVLEFDHEDPAQKSLEVVRLADLGLAWSRILAEIEKCSVRCANCHRRRTMEMFGYWRHAAEERRRSAARLRAEGRLAALLSAR